MTPRRERRLRRALSRCLVAARRGDTLAATDALDEARAWLMYASTLEYISATGGPLSPVELAAVTRAGERPVNAGADTVHPLFIQERESHE